MSKLIVRMVLPFALLLFATTAFAGERENKLIEASANGNVKTVKALLAKGANVNAKDIGGVTALMYASRMGHTEIVRILMAAGGF